MAKGYNSRGGFGGLNMNQLMKQAKKMQEDVTKSQEEISAKDFESTAGGGAVSVVVSGDKKVKSITISKDVVAIFNSKDFCTFFAFIELDTSISRFVSPHNFLSISHRSPAFLGLNINSSTVVSNIFAFFFKFLRSIFSTSGFKLFINLTKSVLLMFFPSSTFSISTFS